MSDDIICCVDGCNIDAEVEVERKGSTLWICSDHHNEFFPKAKTTDRDKELAEEIRKELDRNGCLLNTSPDKDSISGDNQIVVGVVAQILADEREKVVEKIKEMHTSVCTEDVEKAKSHIQGDLGVGYEKALSDVCNIMEADHD